MSKLLTLLYIVLNGPDLFSCVICKGTSFPTRLEAENGLFSISSRRPELYFMVMNDVTCQYVKRGVIPTTFHQLLSEGSRSPLKSEFGTEDSFLLQQSPQVSYLSL